MKKFGTGLMIVFPIALFGWALALVLTAPPEPAFDWRQQMSAAQHDTIVATINHLYTRAAYIVTWAIQTGYLAWMGLRWQKAKQQSAE